jgi:Uma2 family endonuclease
MVAVQQTSEPLRMTEAEYLAFERQSASKHEYIQGEVFAMAGASWEHNMICSYTNAALIALLGDKPCQVSHADMRVKTPLANYIYPDLLVVCGEPQFEINEFDNLLNPTLIIEVLSPSTELYDRSKKFELYRSIDSLQEYLLVSQDKARIERFLRQNDVWVYSEVRGRTASLLLPSLDCTLALADVYRKVTFANDEK